MTRSNRWTRRRVLALAGGTAALAGCAAEEVDPADENGSDGEDDEGGNESADGGNATTDDPEKVDGPDDQSDEDAEDGGGSTDAPENETDGDGNGQAGTETDGEGGESPDDGDEGGNESEPDDSSGDEPDGNESEPDDSSGDEPDGNESGSGSDEGDGDTGEEDTEDAGGDEDDGDNGDGDDGDEDVAEPPLSDVTITVVGPAGEPIPGASVTGEGDPHEAEIPLEFSGETDRGGRHDNRIYENEYTIEVDHPDYEATTVEHTHDGESELRVELEAAVDTAEITVTVVGPAGEPIEGASVTGEGAPGDVGIPLEFSGETDGDGEYTDVVYENVYAIEADHPDYRGAVVSHTHDGESGVRIELGSEAETSRLRLAFTDPAGEPIEGVSVAGEGKFDHEEIPLEFSGETDGDGEYTDVVYENNYRVEIDHPDYESRTIHFIHADGTDLSLTLDPL